MVVNGLVAALLYQFVEADLRDPAKLGLGLAGFGAQGFDIGGAEVAGVDSDDGSWVGSKSN